MTLLLTIPAQQQSQNQDLILASHDLKAWISQLPTSAIATTVASLDKQISGLNELQLDNRERFNLLEIYHEAYDAILQTYDDMRLRQLKVTPRERMNLVKQIMWLYVKLGHGYKIIVKNACDSGLNPKKETFLLTSIFRSLELISLSLMFAKRCRTSAPPRFLLETNQLYKYAEQFEVQQTPVRAAKGYAKMPTVAGFHSLIMLLDMMQLERLESLQIQTLFYALQPFSLQCRHSRHAPKDTNYLYEFNLDEDRAGKPCTTEAKNSHAAVRFLCLDALAQELQNWLQTNQSEDNFMIETELALFPDLLQRLENNRLSAQTASQSGLSNIIKTGGTVHIATGLVSIQSLLISELAHLPVGLNNKLDQWTVSNVTAHGCELIRKAELQDVPVSLGECVAVVTKSDNESRFSVKTVALIHKTELLPDQHLSIHIEYLSEHATPIGYHVDNLPNNADDLSSGILMPQGSAMCNQPYLIVHRKHYQENRRFSIKLPDKIIHVQPKKLIMNTVHYAIFLYNVETEAAGVTERIRDTA